MAKRSIWVVLPLFLAVALSMSLPGLAAETGKVGVVDLQRCLNESKIGKKYKADFTAKAEAAKSELQKKESQLKELRESLEKQSLVLSAAAKAEKEKDYRQKVDAFKEQFSASQQSLRKQDQELTARILKDLRSLIQTMGEEGGYALIVEKQEGGVLYMPKAEDLTDEVIRRYDQLEKAQ